MPDEVKEELKADNVDPKGEKKKGVLGKIKDKILPDQMNRQQSSQLL